MTEFAAIAKESHQSIFHKICAAPMRRSAKTILGVAPASGGPPLEMLPALASNNKSRSNNNSEQQKSAARRYLLGAIVTS
jgi:hypothetical protein